MKHAIGVADREPKVKSREEDVEQAVVDKRKKDRKSKKNKKHAALEEEKEAVESKQEEQVEAGIQENEPSKKKKKRKQKHQTEGDEQEETKSHTPDAAENENDADAPSKKKKKKKRSQEAEAPAETGNGDEAADEDDKPKKKKKKQKRSDDGESKRSVDASWDVESFRAEHEIKVSEDYPADCAPIQHFQEAEFDSRLLGYCADFSAPTPIQRETWPLLHRGRDIVGIAQTGSGKTLAFSMPGLNHILDRIASGQAPANGVMMLVLCPTRELAQQCARTIEDLGKPAGIKAVCVHGGVHKDHQRNKLQRAAKVCVATPGRLKDFLEEGSADLSNVSYLVLDEADRMLDLGFEQDVRTIIAQTNQQRQTAMFSATWPKSVQSIAAEFMQSPVKVVIGGEELSSNERVTQIVEVVQERDRERKLLDLLRRYHSSRTNRVIVFVLYKKEAARIEHFLMRNGWQCVSVHGDKTQADRDRAVNEFSDGTCSLLVATDVATRGLDIADVEYVINFSFPLTIEDYIHRIGRTGRAGKTGTAHTFFHDGDKARAGELVNTLRQANANVPEALMKFGTHVKKKEHKLYGAFAKDVNMDAKPKKITFADDDD